MCVQGFKNLLSIGNINFFKSFISGWLWADRLHSSFLSCCSWCLSTSSRLVQPVLTWGWKPFPTLTGHANFTCRNWRNFNLDKPNSLRGERVLELFNGLFKCILLVCRHFLCCKSHLHDQDIQSRSPCGSCGLVLISQNFLFDLFLMPFVALPEAYKSRGKDSKSPLFLMFTENQRNLIWNEFPKIMVFFFPA